MKIVIDVAGGSDMDNELTVFLLQHKMKFTRLPDLQQANVGNVALLTTALRHVAQWSDKEEDMWDDPGYCAIEALENYEASKVQINN